MLEEIRIQNFAVIEDLDCFFNKGFIKKLFLSIKILITSSFLKSETNPKRLSSKLSLAFLTSLSLSTRI